MEYKQALDETLAIVNKWIDDMDLSEATKTETKIMTGFMHMFLSVMNDKLELNNQK